MNFTCSIDVNVGGTGGITLMAPEPRTMCARMAGATPTCSRSGDCLTGNYSVVCDGLRTIILTIETASAGDFGIWDCAIQGPDQTSNSTHLDYFGMYFFS